MVTYRLWKRTRTRPSRAVCKRHFGGCENVRLRVDHTMRMPAKVGPKRDRALARAGCYFDGSAATCGARDECSICEESGDCVRASEIVMLAWGVFSALRPLHVIASEAKQSILSLRRRMDCFASLAMTVDTVSPSRDVIRPRFASSFVAQKSEGAGKTGCTLHPRSRVPNAQTKMHTSIQVQRKHSGLPCAMALRLIASSPR